MLRGVKRLAWLRSLRDILGVSADLITVSGLLLIVLVAVVGIASNNLLMTLILSLVVAALTILWCLYRIVRLSRRCTELRRCYWELAIRTDDGYAIRDVLIRGLDRGGGDSHKPKKAVSPWLPDPDDPRSFRMNASDFEAAHELAKKSANPNDGSAAVKFDSAVVTVGLTLDLRTSVIVYFHVEEPSTKTETVVTFYGAPDRREAFTRDAAESAVRDVVGSVAERPWRDDLSWQLLWDAALQKVQARNGVFVLAAVPRGAIGNESLWVVSVEDQSPTGSLRLFSWSARAHLVEHRD